MGSSFSSLLGLGDGDTALSRQAIDQSIQGFSSLLRLSLRILMAKSLRVNGLIGDADCV